MTELSNAPHQVTRIRRDVRRRMITVTRAEQLTPKMRRIHFASPDLRDFESDAADDHVKLFIPDLTGANGGRTFMRDYTPRAFDRAAGTLILDFALHGAGHEVGPATAWALAAEVNDVLEIGGPRGSTIIADDFDWYLLIGDETALPAIGRRLETLRPDVPVTAIIAVDGDADRQTFVTRTKLTAVWAPRTGGLDDDAGLLRHAVASLGQLPAGDGFIWIAAEAQVARALRLYARDVLNQPKGWMKASGYWSRGQTGVHDKIDD